jgi:GAF domain-containing protein
MSTLLLVRQQLAVGLAVHGAADTAGEIQALVVPLNTPSILQRVYANRTAESCAVENDGMLRMIAAYLQQPSLKQGCVVPVILADRVINLLCVFSASGATFDEEEIIDLQDLATYISHAYAKLIRRKK